MADFSLAREAYADLEDIDRYTLETWGEEQRVAYVTGLFDQLDTIAGNPGLGRLRNDVDEGVFSLPYERHVIFYEMHLGAVVTSSASCTPRATCTKRFPETT